MAYRRASASRRSYASKRTPARGRGTRRSAAPRSRRGVTAQTLRIVIEQVPASGVSRPAGPFVTQAAAKPKKAKF